MLDRLRDRLTERRMRKLSDRFVEWYARDEYDDACLDCPHPEECVAAEKCALGVAKLGA